MKRVLVNKPIHPDALEVLAREVELLTPYKASPEEIFQLLADVNGLVLCAGLSVTAAVLEACPKLEVIGRHGAGLETVDLVAAARRGLPVVYTPFGPTQSTAEHALLLMMATARRLPLLDRATRAGDFHIRDGLLGRELMGGRLGIVGLGRIGGTLARMCQGALNMEIYAYDPPLGRAAVEAQGATYAPDLTEMAGLVDVLSIHCPLTPQSHHLVDGRVIAAMKPEAILVNAARGPVVDEAALIEALQASRIAGAGLDVFDPEPPSADNPLYSMDNVVLTPHLASGTREGRRRMGMTVAADVLRVLRGESPEFPVPVNPA